jgi:succinate-semialdehyde dehydrogenase/glutarate-semialdehyde dehydrogenase
MSVETIDPATGLPLATYEEASPDEVDAILAQAHDAAAVWRLTPPAERADSVRRLAGALRDSREELAMMATREMGKPLVDSRAEVEKCAWACEWFADHGPKMLEPEPIETEAVRTNVVYVPLGVLFAIMPWNFPYWQVIRALAPALTAGNVVVLKHAPSTTGCGLLLADAAAEAGLPGGVFSVLIGGFEHTPELSERVITDDRVAAVTITGSTGAGRAVAAIAGRALKKTVLELGGSDPLIVLADADLDAAAAWAARSRFQNAGQSCIATKRMIVEDQGARVLAGGRAPDLPGFYYEPTVLDQVTATMPVLTEEVFGPAVPVIRAVDAADAVRLANDTRFGLGSNVWTSDLARGEEIAVRLDAGHTAVNGMTASDPRLPFGGMKDSGYGRELSSYGIHEFVNVHTIVVDAPTGPSGDRQTTIE